MQILQTVLLEQLKKRTNSFVDVFAVLFTSFKSTVFVEGHTADERQNERRPATSLKGCSKRYIDLLAHGWQ